MIDIKHMYENSYTLIFKKNIYTINTSKKDIDVQITKEKVKE
jgi:hypothetical protein